MRQARMRVESRMKNIKISANRMLWKINYKRLFEVGSLVNLCKTHVGRHRRRDMQKMRMRIWREWKRREEWQITEKWNCHFMWKKLKFILSFHFLITHHVSKISLPFFHLPFFWTSLYHVPYSRKKLLVLISKTQIASLQPCGDFQCVNASRFMQIEISVQVVVCNEWL